MMSPSPTSSQSEISLLRPLDSLDLNHIPQDSAASARCTAYSSLEESCRDSRESLFNPWEYDIPQPVQRPSRPPSPSLPSNPSPSCSSSQLPRPSPTTTHPWLSTPDVPTATASPCTVGSTLYSAEDTLKGTGSAKSVSETDPTPCTITQTAIICEGDMYQATYRVEGDPRNGISVSDKTTKPGRDYIKFMKERFDNYGAWVSTEAELMGDIANEGLPQPGCIKCTIRPPGPVETEEQMDSEDDAETIMGRETGTVFGRLHMNETGTELTLQIWCPADKDTQPCRPRNKKSRSRRSNTTTARA